MDAKPHLLYLRPMPLLPEHVRSVLRSARQTLKETHAQVLRKLGKPSEDWSRALQTDELSFWEEALSDPEGKWLPSEFNERTNPELELQSFLQELIAAPVGASVRILDVGAGPLTRIGKRWEGRSLEIIAVDPLAKQYDVILNRRQLVPPVRTTFGLAEDLTSFFPRNSFDLAYASNSLDHSRDPIKAINEMLEVTKPGAYVYLWHFANVGIVELYGGLHQWNFDIVDDEFFISDGRKKFSLRQELLDAATLTCEVQHAFNCRVVVAKIRKRNQ